MRKLGLAKITYFVRNMYLPLWFRLWSPFELHGCSKDATVVVQHIEYHKAVTNIYNFDLVTSAWARELLVFRFGECSRCSIKFARS